MAGQQSPLQQSRSFRAYDKLRLSHPQLKQLGMKVDDHVGGTWKLPDLSDQLELSFLPSIGSGAIEAPLNNFLKAILNSLDLNM